MTALLALAGRLPAWVWVVIALGGWGMWSRHQVNGAKAALVAEQAAAAQSAAEAERRERDKERMLRDEAQRIDTEGRAALARAGRDAAGARAAADRLRLAAHAVASNCTGSSPAAAGVGETGATVVVLPDVLNRIAGRAVELAGVADEAIARGRSCEAAHDSVRR